MLNQNEIIVEASGFVSKQLNVPAESINSSCELKSLGMDSFRIIELVLFLERRTGLSFPDHAYTLGNLKSVDSIVACFLKLK